MDACQGPCLHHCTAKSRVSGTYFATGLGIGLVIAALVFKYIIGRKGQ
jgi:hypothetical protein